MLPQISNLLKKINNLISFVSVDYDKANSIVTNNVNETATTVAKNDTKSGVDGIEKYNMKTKCECKK